MKRVFKVAATHEPMMFAIIYNSREIGNLDLTGWASHKHAEWSFSSSAPIPSRSTQYRLLRDALAKIAS